MAGKSNMELLLRDEDRIDSVLSKWWNPAAAATIGLVTIVFLRAFQRRPLYSGTYLSYIRTTALVMCLSIIGKYSVFSEFHSNWNARCLYSTFALLTFFVLNTMLTAIFVMYIRQRLSHTNGTQKKLNHNPRTFRPSQRCR